MRSDNRFIELSPKEKLIFSYLITNDKVSLCGIYEMPIMKMMCETWIDKQTLWKALKGFESVWKVIYKDWRVVVVNFMKNQSLNDNMKKWVARELEKIGIDKLNSMAEWKGFERVRKAFESFGILNLTLLNLTIPNNINTTELVETPSEEQSSTSLVVNDWKKEITKKINSLVNMIKEECKKMWVAYDKTQERNFWRHIVTAKEYGSFCETVWMSREEFACAILVASVKINYWKWARSWPKSIYQDYADVYNKAKWSVEKKPRVVDLSMYNKSDVIVESV